MSVCTRLKEAPGGQAARWVAPENTHVTLKFLGDVHTHILPDICQVVAEACLGTPPFYTTVAGLGCFPGTGPPRIIWAAIAHGASELGELATAIDLALHGLGFPVESKPISPHITLARADRHATGAELAKLSRTIASQRATVIGGMDVSSVSVIRSDLDPAGPVYTDIASVLLGVRPGSEA